MFVPITSEVTIKTGMVLQEIATEMLYEVGHRLKNAKEINGPDIWEITEIAPDNLDRIALALPRQELSMKYFAEVED